MGLLCHSYTCDRCGVRFDADPETGPQWICRLDHIAYRSVLLLMGQSPSAGLALCGERCSRDVHEHMDSEEFFDSVREFLSELLAGPPGRFVPTGAPASEGVQACTLCLLPAVDRGLCAYHLEPEPSTPEHLQPPDQDSLGGESDPPVRPIGLCTFVFLGDNSRCVLPAGHAAPHEPGGKNSAKQLRQGRPAEPFGPECFGGTDYPDA